MNPVLLHIDFDFGGPWGEELTKACDALARDIAQEPGLRWKVWTEDQAGQRAGGEYLFDSRANAQRYLEKHVQRVKAMGAVDVQARLYEVNVPLTQITLNPLF